MRASIQPRALAHHFPPMGQSLGPPPKVSQLMVLFLMSNKCPTLEMEARILRNEPAGGADIPVFFVGMSEPVARPVPQSGIRVLWIAILVTTTYSTAMSKLRRPFISDQYFFVTVRLLRWRARFTEGETHPFHERGHDRGQRFFDCGYPHYFPLFQGTAVKSWRS